MTNTEKIHQRWLILLTAFVLLDALAGRVDFQWTKKCLKELDARAFQLELHR